MRCTGTGHQAMQPLQPATWPATTEDWRLPLLRSATVSSQDQLVGHIALWAISWIIVLNKIQEKEKSQISSGFFWYLKKSETRWEKARFPLAFSGFWKKARQVKKTKKSQIGNPDA